MNQGRGPSRGSLGRLIFGIVIAAAAAGAWFGMDYFAHPIAPSRPSLELKAGTPLPKPKALKPFTLTDQNGKPFTLDNLRGHWTFLAIGYTSCPDICPTTLATFRALSRQVTPKGAKPAAQFVFVSVDPGRDTPERLAQYVHYFDPNFLGATGTDRNLKALTGQLGLPYARVEDKGSALGYLMDHSAAIVLIDPKARLTAVFSSPHGPKAMAADFAAIRAQRPPPS